MARILLIDDDPSILELASLVLYEEGHELLVADEALTPLDLLQFYEVDLVIVDINMPRFTGFQFVTTLRHLPHFKDIPIAFLSSRNEKDDILRAAELGADLYLVKPIKRSDFIERIRGFFNRYPAKERPKFEFQSPKAVPVKVQQDIQVLNISDLGIEILIDQNLKRGQKLEIPGSIFHESLDENILFKVTAVKIGPSGLKQVYLSYLHQTATEVRKIQKYITTKKQPVLMKYPKTRM